MLEFYLKKEQTASVERAIPYGIASLARAFLPLGDVRFFDASGLFADILVAVPPPYSPFWRCNLLSTESPLSAQFPEVLGDAIAKSVGFVNDS
jgi:hypothetical protein